MRDSASIPAPGDFVEVCTRRWLVESVTGGDAFVRARLACIDDDAQGETLEVLWCDEVDASVIADRRLSGFENPGTDDPIVFSAYLRSIRWNTATAADRQTQRLGKRDELVRVEMDASSERRLKRDLIFHGSAVDQGRARIHVAQHRMLTGKVFFTAVVRASGVIEHSPSDKLEPAP